MIKKALTQKPISRRSFMTISAAAGAGAVAGCMTDPVTGKKRFSIISQAYELSLDKQWAPHQFSTDYGAVQDDELNNYVNDVGQQLGSLSHRPRMPYNFRVLNAVVVNGYTLPAGSVGLARGLMLAMKDESELAAVLGHEVGHVNKRHAAERMSKNIVAQLAIAAIQVYTQKEYEEYAALAAGLGAVGANLLLARYSRDDEREADELGMLYASQATINPRGMVGLMETFRSLRQHEPSTVELLMATHPLSNERYQTAVNRMQTEYTHASGFPVNRERYMDTTARLRKKREAIQDLQKGQQAMMMKAYSEAEEHFRSGLRKAPADYAGLLMMSKCYLAMNLNEKAKEYARRAKQVYPSEPQAKHVSGMAHLHNSQFGLALNEFRSYEKALPGNSNTTYFQGLCFDKMGRKKEAAELYAKYHNNDPGGQYSGNAATRLVEWGYMEKPQQ